LLLVFLSFHTLVEGVVGVGQDRDVVEGSLAGVGEEKAYVAQAEPRSDLRREVTGLILGFGGRGRGGGSRRRGGSVVVPGGFVLLEQALDGALRIAAGALQILLGVLEFVLIEFELSFGDIDLVLDVFFCAFFRGGELVGEVGDLVLIVFDDRGGLGGAEAKLTLFGGGRGRMLGGLAECVGEGEIKFVVGQAESLTGEILFLGSGGEGGQLARGLQRVLVDGGGGLGGGVLFGFGGPGEVRAIGQEDAKDGREDEHQQYGDRDPLASFHRVVRGDAILNGGLAN
jgi:hypothetical protein